ncbi:MAG: hypothetical protein CR982_06675 [Candidatus Cloacimonadota bacterium]|nr:MAG: hypothetical protein CR982_06675 [Candidatus Cloacimonadota bacterium]PIE77833.1 MAG: hypothetical protein CSA15_11090 [Candidatus Delongbacteria bacterium]
MNLLDIVIVLFISFSAYGGYKKGFTSNISVVIGLLASILFTSRLTIFAVDYLFTLEAYKDYDKSLISFISGVVLFFALFLVFRIIGSLFFRPRDYITVSVVNRVFGILVGAVKGLLLLTVLVFIVRLTPWEGFFMNFTADEPSRVETMAASNDSTNKELVVNEEKVKDGVGDTIKEVQKDMKEIESDMKEVSKKALDKVKDLNNITKVLTGNDTIPSDTTKVVESETIVKRSNIGYILYKFSTLLDPIRDDFKAYMSNRVKKKIESMEKGR